MNLQLDVLRYVFIHTNDLFIMYECDSLYKSAVITKYVQYKTNLLDFVSFST